MFLSNFSLGMAIWLIVVIRVTESLFSKFIVVIHAIYDVLYGMFWKTFFQILDCNLQFLGGQSFSNWDVFFCILREYVLLYHFRLM